MFATLTSIRTGMSISAAANGWSRDLTSRIRASAEISIVFDLQNGTTNLSE